MARPPASPPREMTVTDLLQIETWARHGLDLDTIATLLHLTRAEFQAAAKHDVRTYECYIHGRASGGEEIAKVLYTSAKSGRDTAAAKLYLERIIGANWAKPHTTSPTITLITPYVPANIDQDAMAARFARQRRLIDGTADELRDGPPSPPEVPPDPPGKG